MHILRNIRISYHKYFYMWTHVARTHICLCPCECSHLDLFAYIHVLTSIHIFHHRYFCIWSHVVQADICLHPCECSHLERHCIHTYTHKYTYIKNHITDTIEVCKHCRNRAAKLKWQDLMRAGKWCGPHSWLVLPPELEPFAKKRF